MKTKERTARLFFVSLVVFFVLKPVMKIRKSNVTMLGAIYLKGDIYIVTSMAKSYPVSMGR